MSLLIKLLKVVLFLLSLNNIYAQLNDFIINGRIVNTHQTPLEKIIVETRVNYEGKILLLRDTTNSEGKFTHIYRTTNIQSEFVNQKDSELRCSLPFPNPANETLSIRLNTTSKQYISWKVFDVTMAEILSGTVLLNPGISTLTIPLYNQPSGVLFFYFTNGIISSLHKFVHLKGYTPQLNSTTTALPLHLSPLESVVESIIEQIAIIGINHPDYTIKDTVFALNIPLSSTTDIGIVPIDDTRYSNLTVMLRNIFKYQTPQEAGLPNVVVSLLDSARNVITQQKTDASGNIYFKNIPHTAYIIAPDTSGRLIPYPERLVNISKHESVILDCVYIPISIDDPDAIMNTAIYSAMVQNYTYKDPEKMYFRRYPVDPARAQETFPKFYIHTTDQAIATTMRNAIINDFMPHVKHPYYPEKIIPHIEVGNNPPVFGTAAANNYIIIYDAPTIATDTLFGPSLFTTKNIIDPATGAIQQSFIHFYHNVAATGGTSFLQYFTKSIFLALTNAVEYYRYPSTPGFGVGVLSILDYLQRKYYTPTPVDDACLLLLYYLPVPFKAK